MVSEFNGKELWELLLDGRVTFIFVPTIERKDGRKSRTLRQTLGWFKGIAVHLGCKGKFGKFNLIYYYKVDI